MSNLFEDLQARGLVNQLTDETLSQKINTEKFTLYVGFDPTSDSLHLGSLLPVMTMRRFQLAGHKVIAVVGGATGRVGDPSGKSAERKLLDRDQIEHNLKGISKVLLQFLDSDQTLIRNNADWFEGLSYLDFLRDVGKHFTVNHMMAKESVRARLEDREHGISYTEFSYMLLQAYDFYHLNQKEGCTLQVGGSDQWGNITAGCELIRRMAAANHKTPPSVFGFTHPLITKSDGGKFGKTEEGAVWLSADKTSPYQFYQYLVRTSDSDVIQLLKFLTFVPINEIQALEKSVQTEPEKRLAQKRLAEELTRLAHGEEELKRVQNASQALFGTEIQKLDEKTLKEVFAEAPSTELARSTVAGEGLSLIDLLVSTGLCKSKGAARKDLVAGGIYVNNERQTDPALQLSVAHLIDEKLILLRKGKKNYHLVVFKP